MNKFLVTTDYPLTLKQVNTAIKRYTKAYTLYRAQNETLKILRACHGDTYLEEYFNETKRLSLLRDAEWIKQNAAKVSQRAHRIARARLKSAYPEEYKTLYNSFLRQINLPPEIYVQEVY